MDAVARDPFPLRDLILALPGAAGGRWRIREDDDWCHLAPPESPARVQGWKLHVSATWLSAPVVLHRAAQVLVAHGCGFKFVPTLGRIQELTGKSAGRAQAGKILTAYPRDDDHLRTLARLLDEATAGLPGPAVPSDRPVRPGSLVHYRYGAFHGVPVLTNDGAFETRLAAPDGTLEQDHRRPWFCPPSWAPAPPFRSGPGRPAGPPDQVRPVLLDDRFRVEAAVVQNARGGVFRAVDMHTGQRVVIKQARPHIGGLELAGDGRDGLRHEAAMLAALSGLGPEVVALFTRDDRLFLAVTELAGRTWGAWVHSRWQDPSGPDSGGPGVTTAEAAAMAGRMADLVDAVHGHGYVYRDLTPGNVMVLDDGALRVVDAELAAAPGQWVTRASTPGFAAPEVLTAPPFGPAPGPPADHFALGALLCQLVTGAVPVFPPDGPGGRPVAERFALLLDYAGAGSPAARQLAPAIRGLTADGPGQRWDTDRLRAFLAGSGTGPPATGNGRSPAAGGARPTGPGDGRLPPDRQRELAADGLSYLAEALDGRAGDGRLVTSDPDGSRSDPGNVQHGAAGVLAVLVRGAELGAQPELAAAVERVARWLDHRRVAVSPLLPGLYFGRSGTAWAQHTAAGYLDDARMATRALELAAALPVRWPNPDLTHGTAGAGMASLHLWLATGEPAFRERVDTAVDHLATQASSGADGNVYWRVPPDFDSAMAGIAQYGFAHGMAGIGAFLLAASQATGRTDARDLAVRTGESLAAGAVRVAGAAYWPNDVSGPAESDFRYRWCSGASGVGTFLVRLWRATGEPRYRELTHGAAVMVHRGRWLAGESHCHGLAGDGEFLLDLAAAGGADDPYRGWAEELAGCLHARHAWRHGDRLVPGGSGERPNLAYGTGLAGVVGYLLRLRHGGPRWWMADHADAGPPGGAGPGSGHEYGREVNPHESGVGARPGGVGAAAGRTARRGGPQHQQLRQVALPCELDGRHRRRLVDGPGGSPSWPTAPDSPAWSASCCACGTAGPAGGWCPAPGRRREVNHMSHARGWEWS